MKEGKITKVHKISASKRVPVTECMEMQRRFRHLFQDERGWAEIDRIQALADANIEKYGLMD
jgi:pyruvate ferredoxin oxidoreductase beta subunit